MDAERLFFDGVDELDLVGPECDLLAHLVDSRPVFLVTVEGVAQVLHLDADLVGPPRL